MPDPITHVVSPTVATSGGIVGGISMALGVDPAALFLAFLGALVWQGVQPKVAPTFTSIRTAFSWSVASMVLGTLGGMGAAYLLKEYHPQSQGMPDVVAIGIPSFLLSLGANPIVMWLLDRLKEWRPIK